MIPLLIFIYIVINLIISTMWIVDWHNGELQHFSEKERPFTLVVLILFGTIALALALVYHYIVDPSDDR